MKLKVVAKYNLMEAIWQEVGECGPSLWISTDLTSYKNPMEQFKWSTRFGLLRSQSFASNIFTQERRV